MKSIKRSNSAKILQNIKCETLIKEQYRKNWSTQNPPYYLTCETERRQTNATSR